MILSPKHIREEIKKKNIRFDPPIEERQWGEASINLRLGFTFTHFLPAAGIIFRLSDGIGALRDANVWKEEVYKDAAGRARPYILEPGDFVLGMTHERVWIPRHLIGMVEGRSTYARAGLSMHQTAPWRAEHERVFGLQTVHHRRPQQSAWRMDFLSRTSNCLGLPRCPPISIKSGAPTGCGRASCWERSTTVGDFGIFFLVRLQWATALTDSEAD